MEPLETVDNEPTSRPFQCDWDACNKVRCYDSHIRPGLTDLYRALIVNRTCRGIIEFTQTSGRMNANSRNAGRASYSRVL